MDIELASRYLFACPQLYTAVEDYWRNHDNQAELEQLLADLLHEAKRSLETESNEVRRW